MNIKPLPIKLTNQQCANILKDLVKPETEKKLMKQFEGSNVVKSPKPVLRSVK